jgi:hypothetical protein
MNQLVEIVIILQQAMRFKCYIRYLLVSYVLLGSGNKIEKEVK